MNSPADMTDQEKANVRAWIRNWQKLGPILEHLRAQSIRKANTARAIGALDLVYQSARLQGRHRATSGLVEQQRWFKRGHR